MRDMKGRRIVILHNIRSTHNVGSIFRTADGAGVDEIYLTGYTPLPIDRFGRVQKDIAKTALGAEKAIRWKYIKSPAALIEQLKKEGVQMIAVEQSKDAIAYTRVRVAGKSAILLGNEVRGVSPALLKRCDVVAEIPMQGMKESLNVSVAAGIALFRFFA